MTLLSWSVSILRSKLCLSIHVLTCNLRKIWNLSHRITIKWVNSKWGFSLVTGIYKGGTNIVYNKVCAWISKTIKWRRGLQDDLGQSEELNSSRTLDVQTLFLTCTCSLWQHMPISITTHNEYITMHNFINYMLHKYMQNGLASERIHQSRSCSHLSQSAAVCNRM